MTVTILRLVVSLCTLVEVIVVGGILIRRMDKRVSWRDWLLMAAGIAAICTLPFLYFALKGLLL